MAEERVPDPLESARAKLEWANVHTAALRVELRDRLQFADGTRPVLSAVLHQEAGYYEYRVASLPDYADFERETALKAGDIIHNHRSALDHSAWAAAMSFKDPPDDPRGVQFPIAETPDAFQGGSVQRTLKQVAPIHADL